MAPGDPAEVIAGEMGAADAQFVADVRRDFGLDRPLPEQLAVYVMRAATFDFGNSFREHRPVMEIVVERLPATLLLTLSAFGFALVSGVALGVVAGRRQGTALDAAITVVSLIFFAMPLFWLGLMAIVLFSVKLQWLPAYGMATIGADLGPVAALVDLLRHLAMPALTLGLFYMAVYMRVTRAAVAEVVDQDFVRTARAKGVPDARIWRRHVLRNALLPVITFATIQAGHIVGGSVLIETVFAWPGIGRLAFDALFQRDYNLLLAIFFVCSVMVIVFNLIADLLYRIADPRIEVSS
jgi:peptide/nickel transport system permease protein